MSTIEESRPRKSTGTKVEESLEKSAEPERTKEEQKENDDSSSSNIRFILRIRITKICRKEKQKKSIIYGIILGC